MSGPKKDLVGEPNDAACSECHTIYSGPKALERVLRCKERHRISKGREACRAFARTGKSQRQGAGK